ncbi:thiamine-phosphate kinase, partial [Bordetella petrii]|uniref:thiamine-phosphate kinase n=1 Tax=Bordetella petrii TaxID=94624 RepID=UPI001E5D277A
METILASEFDLIARYFSRPVPAGMLGVGDDCALFPVPAGMQIATSTDLLIQGRHFFPDVDPQALGHKSLAVNLSDLAAMGARPIGCVLGLALPQASAPWLSAFARGFHDLADAHGCPLMGGDTTRSPNDLAISVTVFGAVPSGRALRRDAARAGDQVWVSGSLGAADVAYRILAGRRRYPVHELLRRLG